MDPDETLRMARVAATDLEEALNMEDGFVVNYSGKSEAIENAATDLLEYFQAMDKWLSSSGFLPAAWERGVKRAAERSK